MQNSKALTYVTSLANSQFFKRQGEIHNFLAGTFIRLDNDIHKNR